ncbi:sensor histidine kinase [Halomicroarcula sp. GCM10025710]
MGRAPRLRSLFENLFRNACEHNERPLTVRVGLIETSAGNATTESLVGFYVEDDGGGIPAEERDRIFDHGYTTNTEGTGFGLSIVSRVVDSHDWTISICEETKQGTRFEITDVELEG